MKKKKKKEETAIIQFHNVSQFVHVLAGIGARTMLGTALLTLATTTLGYIVLLCFAICFLPFTYHHALHSETMLS